MAEDLKAKSIATEIDKKLLSGDSEGLESLLEDLLNQNRSAGLAYKGIYALKKDDLDRAEDALLESYRLNPKQNLALANLIPVYIKKKDFKKAKSFGELALAAMPKNDSVKLNYSAALMQDQDYKAALEILEPLYQKGNKSLPLLTGLISCYRSIFNTSKAHELLEETEALFPEKPEVSRLRADTLAEQDPRNALVYFEKSLSVSPNNIATKWNMSLVQLRLGIFEAGWLNYDCGLLPEVGKIGRPIPKLFEKVPRITDPEKLDPNKWTVAVAEQGIGDQILFLGVLKQFLERYPKTILVAESRMTKILERSFPNCPVYPYGIGPVIATQSDLCNGYIPIGSLQKSYRSSREDFERGKSIYIIPDRDKVERFRKELLEKTSAKKIIGFSWKGGYWERQQKTKTLDVERWGPIFESKDVIFISLQYGDVKKEKVFLSKKYNNVRWIDGIDFKKDLDSWLALACACDEIISVSTALVHFAAAAGTPVHLLLSDLGSPFIWGLEGDKSIAYQDVSIYRKRSDQTDDMFFRLVSNKIFHRER